MPRGYDKFKLLRATQFAPENAVKNITDRQYTIVTCEKSGRQLVASNYRTLDKAMQHVRDRVDSKCYSIAKFVIIGPDAQVVELDRGGLNRYSSMQQIAQAWHQQDRAATFQI